jgi:LPS-assembly protein
MRQNGVSLPLVIVSLLLTASPAIAAPGGGLLGGGMGGALPRDAAAELYAVGIVSDEVAGTITAEGAVDLTYGELRLQADRMVLTDGGDYLKASGNVRFQRKDEYLTGEAIEFSLKDETGIVHGARGFIADFYVTGKEIRKVGEKEYRIIKGSATACEQEVPDWKFASPDARVVIEEYIYAWHPTIWVKKVPVLYLPYLVVPIKTERATGLLVPSIAWSDGAGISYSQDFFWAMAENADTTVGLDFYQRKGVRLRLEFRHVLSAETAGSVSGSWIEDRKDEIERWRFRLDQRLNLGAGVRGVASVDIVSDEDYALAFGESLEERSRQDYDISASIRRRWGNLTASALVDIDRNVTGDYFLGRLPELTIDLGRSRLFTGGPAIEGRMLGATRFESHDEALPSEQMRLMADPKISWPVQPGPYMTLTPSFTWHQAWYSESKGGGSVSRSSPEAELAVTGPTVYRIFEGEAGGVRRRHLIEPRLSYRYRGGVDTSNLYRYDGRDALSEANECELALVNRLSSRKGEEASRDLLRFELRQRYDFRLQDDGNAATDPLAPLRIWLEAQPIPSVTFKAAAEYSHELSKFPQRSVELRYAGGGGNSMRVELRSSDDPDLSFLGVDARLELGRGWGLRYDGRYDLEAGKRIENRLGLGYKSQCWEVKATWTDRSDSSVFRLTLDLKNLGTVLTI